MSISLYDGTVVLTAEAALSAATGTYGAWDVGLWDTATWGPDVVWVDIAPWLRTLSTNRRFSRDVQAWESGTATALLDDRDARFSPSNTTGPYAAAGVTGIRPWRPVRFRASYNAITYDVYSGYALAWQESRVEASPNGGDAVTQVSCSDEYARLAGHDGLEQSSAGGGETSGKRIHRLLDDAGHSGTRNIDDGRVTVQPTTLAANTATEIVLTADSEGGAFYIDPGGVPTFENQYALIENARSNTVQATFGDGPGELPYSDITTEYAGDLVVNIAAFARTNSTAQTSVDDSSRALYGDRRFSRTDFVAETDTQVQALADWYVRRYKDPELRVTSIEIRPRGNPAVLFPQVLGRKVRDLVRIKHRPPGGLTVTQDCFIAGIAHTITGDNWVTRFELWSASPYTSFATSRFGVGTWDSATWFF